MAERDRILKQCAALCVVAAAMILWRPAPCFASHAELYSENVRQRVIAYGIQIAELGGDNVPLEIWRRATMDMAEDTAELAEWKHEAYADDHFTDTTSGRNAVRSYLTGADYAQRFIGGGNYGAAMPGYRTISADGPAHAELYEQRSALWRERMRKILSDNNYAVTDISNRQAHIERTLDDAREAEGYTRRAQAAAYLQLIISDEVSKLNADVDRRLALEAEIAMNEQLKRSDSVAAYALALGSWRAPEQGRGY